MGKKNRILYMLVAFGLLAMSGIGLYFVFNSNLAAAAHEKKSHIDDDDTPTAIVTPIANPSIEMLSTTFSTKSLPSNGKKTMLEQISLQPAGDAQVQVSAMLDLYAGDRGGMPQTSKGTLAKLLCSINLDSTALVSLQREFHRLPVDRSIGLTTTAPVSAGNHTLSVNCSAWISMGRKSNSIIQMSSGGMSAVIASSGTSAATATPIDTPTPTSTDTPTPTPTPACTATPIPTSTPFGTTTPTPTPTGTATPTPTPTPIPTCTVTPTPTGTVTPTPTPTPTATTTT